MLRIQDGNDIFLAAAGAYAPSFFGLSLATLSDLQRCVPLVNSLQQSGSVSHEFWRGLASRAEAMLNLLSLSQFGPCHAVLYIMCCKRGTLK